MERTFTNETAPVNNPTPSVGQRLWRRLKHWCELSRERHQLAEADARTLKDIGVSRHDARLEARRWFWDDPRY